MISSNDVASPREDRKRKIENQTGREQESPVPVTHSRAVRRSPRDKQKINLRGIYAGLFYRNLKKIFFDGQQDESYKSIGTMKNLNRVYNDPPIYVVDDFLNRSQLEYFDKLIETHNFRPSFVDGHEGQSTVDPNRTSSYVDFGKSGNNSIRAIEQKVCDFLGCLTSQIEPIQVVRYFPGEFFGQHHDLADIDFNNKLVLPRRHSGVKHRLVTLFVYLNTLSDKQGGCTHFPDCNNLRIRPKRGRLVFWSNVTSDGKPDPKTVHEGEIVHQGEHYSAKYGLNIWICEE